MDVAVSGTARHPTAIGTTHRTPVTNPMSSRGNIQTEQACGRTALRLCPAKQDVLHLGLQPQHQPHQRSSCQTCAAGSRGCCDVAWCRHASNKASPGVQGGTADCNRPSRHTTPQVILGSCHDAAQQDHVRGNQGKSTNTGNTVHAHQPPKICMQAEPMHMCNHLPSASAASVHRSFAADQGPRVQGQGFGQT